MIETASKTQTVLGNALSTYGQPGNECNIAIRTKMKSIQPKPTFRQIGQAMSRLVFALLIALLMSKAARISQSTEKLRGFKLQIEFVVGSHPFFESFSSGSPFLLPLQAGKKKLLQFAVRYGTRWGIEEPGY